jgi:phosphoribosyl-ATP pyrophosphohydrolase
VPRIVGIAVIRRLIVTDAIKLSELEFPALPRHSSRRGGIDRNTGASPETGSPAVPESRCSVESQGFRPCELDRLYRSLSEVTTETHPRTARLLASSTRKAAQKVIEEAGEVALEAVKHHAGGIVRESADLLYHLVALWRRAGIDPEQVWIEMRMRADTLGIAEKLPKAHGNRRNPRRQATVREE